jgi:hypothetical protein
MIALESVTVRLTKYCVEIVVFVSFLEIKSRVLFFLIC